MEAGSRRFVRETRLERFQPFHLLNKDLFSLVLLRLWLSLDQLGCIRLVCRAWASALAPFIESANKYTCLPESYQEELLLMRNLIPADNFPGRWLVEFNHCTLLAHPSSCPVDLSRSMRLRPMLEKLVRVELHTIACLPPSTPSQASLLSLMDALAWLPNLETLGVGEECILSIDGDEDVFLDALKSKFTQLGENTLLHTVRGNWGFLDYGCVAIFPCLVDVPKLRHYSHSLNGESMDMGFFAHNDKMEHRDFYEHCIHSLSRLQLEGLSKVVDPDRDFWELFNPRSQQRLQKLSVLLYPSEDARSTARELAYSLEQICSVPNLRHLTLELHSDPATEFFCEQEYHHAELQSPENIEMLRQLREEVERLGVSMVVAPTSSLVDMIEYALRQLKPGISGEVQIWP